VAENAVWGYPEPLEDAPPLAGYVAFYWNKMEKMSRPRHILAFILQTDEKRRADERTRTAYPCSTYECAVIGC